VKRGEKGVLGHYAPLMHWSLGNKGTPVFRSGERGKGAGDKGSGRGGSHCGEQCCTTASLSDASQVLDQMAERNSPLNF